MRLEQLQQIVEIERSKSISKAAKNLFIAQPSLSASLTGFEEEIGIKLFKRLPTGVVPTEAGKAILSLAKQALGCIDQIQNYSLETCNLTGDVYLSITHAYSFLISDILMSYKQKYPNANLIVEEKCAFEVIEDITNGTATIGMTTWGMFDGQTEELLKAKHLSFEKFWRHEIRLYVSKNHRFAQKEFVTMQEIKSEQFVTYAPSFWESTNEKVHADKSPLILKNHENMKRLIYENYAIALMPDTFAADDIYCQQGLIKPIDLESGEKITGIDYLIYPQRKELTVLEKGACEILRNILTKLEPIDPPDVV